MDKHHYMIQFDKRPSILPSKVEWILGKHGIRRLGVRLYASIRPMTYDDLCMAIEELELDHWFWVSVGDVVIFESVDPAEV